MAETQQRPPLDEANLEVVRGALEKMETGLPADLDMAKVMLTGLLPPAEQGPVWPAWVHDPDNVKASEVAANEEEETAILKKWGRLPGASPTAPAAAASSSRVSERDERGKR